MKYLKSLIFTGIIVIILAENLKPEDYSYTFDFFGVTTLLYWLALTILWILWRNKKKSMESMSEEWLQEVDSDSSNGLQDKALASRAAKLNVESSTFGYRWLFLISPLPYGMIVIGDPIGFSLGLYIGIVFAMWFITKVMEGFYGS